MSTPDPASPLAGYFGGPDCFSPHAGAIFAAKLAAAEAFGFQGLVPSDTDPAPGLAPRERSRRIFRANLALMRRADFAIFNLTPFRGVSADVGTAYELGFFTGLGKPAFAYANTTADYIGRLSPAGRNGVGDAVDAEGCLIEDFGNADNLMLDGAVAQFGAPLVRLDVPAGETMTNVEGFRACLGQAAAYFARDGRSSHGASPGGLLRAR